jgi:tetratricopeptide (TPR) repeat protein
VDIARLLGAETRKADAALEEADASKNLANADGLRKRSADLRTIESQLIQKLLPREQLNFSSLLYVADACGRLGLYSSAREQYQKILRLAESDAKFKADAKNGLTRVRAQLVGLLRDEGRFEEAVKQADELIASHPRALEPLVAKAQILQAWSSKDPKHYDDCVAQWTRIRLMLGRMPRKPPEYYEAIYNAAACLVDQSRAIKDAEKALQAEQLLKSTLTLSPNLDGPQNVTRYNTLLKRAQAAQGKPAS